MRLALAAAAAMLLAAPALARQQDNGVRDLLACAPKTYDASLDCLDKSLTAENKAVLAGSDNEDLRHGVGNVIRIGWGLWNDGPLNRSLDAVGAPKGADARSQFILDAYIARLRGASNSSKPAGQNSGDAQ
jgi:hypothetical protein